MLQPCEASPASPLEGIMDCVETEVGMQLKYCECCGALWFRRADEEEVYCPACAPVMAEARRWRRTVRLPSNMRVERRVEQPPMELGSIDLEGSAL